MLVGCSSNAAIVAAAAPLATSKPPSKRPLAPSAFEPPRPQKAPSDADPLHDRLFNPRMPWDQEPLLCPEQRQPHEPPPRAASGVPLATPPSMEAAFRHTSLPRLSAIAQVERKFIVASADRVLFAIDQHAADERVRFHSRPSASPRSPAHQRSFGCDAYLTLTPAAPSSLSLQVQLEKLLASTIQASGLPIAGSLGERRLCPPARLALTPHEHSLLSRHRPRLGAWGWRLRDDGADARTLVLEAKPLVQSVELGERAMLEYVEELDATGGGSTFAPPAVLRVLASKACRRAIMFGDTLTLAQCQAVLHELSQCELPFICAHGRPTITPLIDFEALQQQEAPQLYM